MSITLRQLRYFLSAAETGKLSASAATLNVSQSAVTIAIKTLEDQVGAALFERSAQGVTLTRDGQRLLGKARDILALVSDATRAHTEWDDDASNSGRVTVAATDTVMGYFLMVHLARFRARFPKIEVNVVEMDRPQIEKALIQGELDIAVMLVSNLQALEHLTSSVLLPSQRRLWLPPRHPLLSQSAVGLEDIAQEPFIMLTVDEAEDTANSYWARTPHRPHVILRSANVEAVRSAVARGLGVALLSDMVFRPWSLEGDRIEVRDVAERIPSMDIGLAWRAGDTLSPATQEFHDFLQTAHLRH